MAIDLQLDESHDLDLVGGDLVLIRDRLEVLQSVKIRLLFVQFEWAYDAFIGIPWTNGMFDVRTPNVKKEAYVKDAIIQTPGVRALLAFEFNIDRENNGAFIAYQAETVYGPIEQEITI